MHLLLSFFLPLKIKLKSLLHAHTQTFRSVKGLQSSSPPAPSLQPGLITPHPSLHPFILQSLHLWCRPKAFLSSFPLSSFICPSPLLSFSFCLVCIAYLTLPVFLTAQYFALCLHFLLSSYLFDVLSICFICFLSHLLLCSLSFHLSTFTTFVFLFFSLLFLPACLLFQSYLPLSLLLLIFECPICLLFILSSVTPLSYFHALSPFFPEPILCIHLFLPMSTFALFPFLYSFSFLTSLISLSHTLSCYHFVSLFFSPLTVSIPLFSVCSSLTFQCMSSPQPALGGQR